MKCPVFLCFLLTAYLPNIVENGIALNCVAAHPLIFFFKKTKTKKTPNSLKLTCIAYESTYL